MAKLKKASVHVVRKAVERFRLEVLPIAEDVDPFDERHWVSLAMGFFLACGLRPDQAFECADVETTAFARESDRRLWP